MLSRVANAIYWMNRYIERAENYARFFDVNFNLSLELPPNVSNQWKPLVVTTGDWKLYEKYNKNIEKEAVIYFMGFDPNNPNSIYNCIFNARENARSIRPEITKEIWAQVNNLYLLVKEGFKKKLWEMKDPRAYFTQVKEGCQMLYGIFDATLSRNDGWHFSKIGRMIERADKTSRVLDVKYHILLPKPEAVGSPIDLIQWSALLKSASAYDMYLKKYGKLTTMEISNFLILDTFFPRSILHCLIQAEESINIISANLDRNLNEVQKQLGMLRSQLAYTNIEDIISSGLHEFLDNFQLKLNNVSVAIFETFFSIEKIKSQSESSFKFI